MKKSVEKHSAATPLPCSEGTSAATPLPCRGGVGVSNSHPPKVTVGIVSAQRIDFCLNGEYQVNGETVSGPQTVELNDGTILWQGKKFYEIHFQPVNREKPCETVADEAPSREKPCETVAPPTFTLNDVTIGNGFHWERQQKQTFLGSLRLIVDTGTLGGVPHYDGTLGGVPHHNGTLGGVSHHNGTLGGVPHYEGRIWAINELPVEDYLESVIASEMSATSSLEFLKAHAVISRSWLLYQMQKKRRTSLNVCPPTAKVDGHLRWYDREDHTLFDVCADDHCQRYQGVAPSNLSQLGEASAAESGAATSPSWGRQEGAVRATHGQVLTYDGELCDTRFSKCCGGRTEEFQYCWEDTPKPYLQSVGCHWCDTKDKDILRQVLNDYDQETADFHDWTVEYTADELTDLVNDKLQADLGTITDLIPLSRGKSGRIWRLQIVGTKGSLIIGKELEIRRVLSPTHLYSSNFEVEKKEERGERREEKGERREEREYLKFILHGHGWGHGVGLCQIGAAVMAHEGYNYQDILLHYYPGAEIKQLY